MMILDESEAAIIPDADADNMLRGDSRMSEILDESEAAIIPDMMLTTC